MKKISFELLKMVYTFMKNGCMITVVFFIKNSNLILFFQV
jgi:hypothetical protein